MSRAASAFTVISAPIPAASPIVMPILFLIARILQIFATKRVFLFYILPFHRY
jgi:hypothetical protein